MLNLEIQTRRDVAKVIDRAIATFKDSEGMGITEFVTHMHREDQALDIVLSNVTDPRDARDRLDSIAEFARTKKGFEPVRFILHFDDDGGLGRHLVIDIEHGSPNRVQFQSDKADELTRSFADSIS